MTSFDVIVAALARSKAEDIGQKAEGKIQPRKVDSASIQTSAICLRSSTFRSPTPR